MDPILAPAGGETHGIEELTRGMLDFRYGDPAEALEAAGLSE
jgi:hypothetical protein